MKPVTKKWDLYVWCVPPGEKIPFFLHVSDYVSYPDACNALAGLFNEYAIINGVIYPPSGDQVADAYDEDRGTAKELAETLQVEADWLSVLLEDD